jgi:hypothetical protein
MNRWLLTLTCFVLPVAADEPASLTLDPAQTIAQTYGIEGWDRIQTIQFTFNVDLPDRDTPIQRTWRWNVAEDHVTREIAGDQVGIALADDPETQSEDWQQVHQQFINDSYWLLFPFQLVWSNPTMTFSELPQLLPMSQDTAIRYTAQWPSEGGYTPGDAYDLYLDPTTGLIQQWAFRRGGAPGSGRPATWEDHQQLGPILVSLDHHGPAPANEDAGFRLWFTDVQATLTGGTTVTPTAMDE